MKKYEKMAKEYAEAGNHFYPNEQDLARAFEHGFQDAKEMVAKSIPDFTIQHCLDSYLNVKPEVVTKQRGPEIRISDFIMKIGDEEVTD